MRGRTAKTMRHLCQSRSEPTPHPGRAFARRPIPRSLMLVRDRTGSKRRADLCRANRRAAAAFRSLVLQRDTEDVLPRRLLRNARRNDEAKIFIDRPSPTESTRLPCTGKIPPRRHASAGCIPASADTCKVRYLTRRLVVSSTKRSSSASRVFMFWQTNSARLIGGPFQPSFTPCFRCRGAGSRICAGSRAWQLSLAGRAAP